MKIKNLLQIGLLSAFLLVGSCSEDYDGRFEELEQQIKVLLEQTKGGTALATSITALQTQLATLSTAVGTSNTGLTASLTALNTRITTLQTDLNKVIAAQVTATETQALSAVALQDFVDGVKADVADLQIDLTALLANSNVVNGNLIINDAASLKVAKDFGTKVSIITGNLTVNVSTLTAAEVNEVSSLFKVVFGDVTVKSNKTLDLKALSSVGGNLALDIDGNYEFPNLVSVSGTTGVTVKDYATTLLVDFEKLATATSFKTVAPGAAGTVTFGTATSVKLNGGAIDFLTVNKATVVQLWAANNKADLFISATADASVITIAGTLLDGTTGKALQVVGSATSVLNAAAVTKVAALTVTAKTVDFTALASASGNVLLTSTTAVAFPALTTVGAASTITANSAVSFIAPKLVVGTGDVTLGAATTVNVGSIATIDLVTKTVVKNLTLSEQNVDFSTASLIKLEAFSSNAKTSAADVTVDGLNAELVSAVFTGKHGSVVVGSPGTSALGLDKLVTLTTAGTINYLMIAKAAVLATPTLDHTEDAEFGARLVIIENPKLTSFTTKINRVMEFVVFDNALLASFDASSMVSLPLNSTGDTGAGAGFTAGTSYNILISVNFTTGADFAAVKGLKGMFVAEVPATASTPLIPAQYKQNSLLTLKPYLAALYEAAFPTAPAGGTAPGATASVTDTDVYLGYIIAASLTSDFQLINKTGTTDITAGEKVLISQIAAQ